MSTFNKIIQTTRDAFNSHKTKSYEFRINQLKQIKKLFEENENLFTEALKKDLSKSATEAYVMEIGFVLNDIDNCLYNLKDWMKPEKKSTNILTPLDTAYVQAEPLGVVLIFGAWNYPVVLSVQPLVSAIAAGNCAILKPSELSPATADLLSKLIPQYLDNDCYVVVTGGPKEATELLQNKFDHIFYTGSTRVGKIVYEAAAKHLTPVTLELGGKCPAYVDDSVRFDYATQRILWGKLSNCGQTCVAPDYILCSKEVEEKFLKHVNECLKKWYDDDPKTSSDYARIVNKNMFDRLVKLLKSGTIAIGGQHNADDLYIAPTVLTNVKTTDPVMQEEVFGPILPIITVNSIEEAIHFVNSRPKPLSSYVFSTNKSVYNKFIQLTSSGATVVNDAVLHFAVDTLPFGGVGTSGIGNYHGKFGFDCLSHMKAVLVRDYFSPVEKVSFARYPPSSQLKLSMMKFLGVKRRPIKLGFVKYLLLLVIGVVIGICLNQYLQLSIP